MSKRQAHDNFRVAHVAVMVAITELEEDNVIDHTAYVVKQLLGELEVQYR